MDSAKMEQQSNPSEKNHCSEIPVKTQLLCDFFSQRNLIEWPLKVNFKGFKKTHQNWEDWVEKLSIKHAKTWYNTGICDGLLSSLHEIKPNVDIILGLCEYWCPQTNTFMFPWGEATITLEDVNVLAGLSVVGQSVKLSLSGDLSNILDEKLHKVSNILSMTTTDKRATYEAWLEHFNEENGVVEHVGFLAYWLSRCVFPNQNDRVIGKHVFPIAVNLSQGVKIALAPAVLACLYRNLTLLTRYAADYDSLERELSIAGPFHIVQLWALERFPLLGSKLAKPLCFGQLWIARWDKVTVDIKLVQVRSVLRASDGFWWCPCALNLEDRTDCYLGEDEISSCFRDDDELKSFYEFTKPQKLIGIDCTEMYFPKRVLMQFVFNRKIPQEIPSCIPSESLHDSLVSLEKSSQIHKVQNFDNLSNKSTSASFNVIKKCCLGQETDSVDDKNDIHPRITEKSEIEIFDDSRHDSGKKRNSCKKTTDENLECIVIIDSDEEVIEEFGHKTDPRRSANKVRKRFANAAECSLCNFGKMGRGFAGSGISIEQAIDVDDY